MLQSDFLVTGLPGAPANSPTTYAGLLPITHDLPYVTNYFFWYVPSSNTTSNELVVWLNGGPGVTSMEGMFGENGPWNIEANGTLTLNEYSWHHRSHMLYVDQPVGTGYSLDTSGVNAFSSVDAGKWFYSFLDTFYQMFPDTRKSELYITGESYAGVYIPYIANELLNRQVLSDNSTLKLAGIAVGNGLLNSTIQSNGGLDMNLVLLESDFYSKFPAVKEPFTKLVTECANVTSQKEADKFPYKCDYWEAVVNMVMDSTSGKECISTTNYNITFPCDAHDSFDAMQDFFGQAAVQRALHVYDTIKKINPKFNYQLGNEINISGDDSIADPAGLISGIIASGVKVLVFEGDLDLKLGWVGMAKTMAAMEWGGERGFEGVGGEWKSYGGVAGQVWFERGLKYIRVYGAGHMVPRNQPQRGLHLLSEIISDPSPAKTMNRTRVTSSFVAQTRSGARRFDVGGTAIWIGLIVGFLVQL